jgi:hypothetical protein
VARTTIAPPADRVVVRKGDSLWSLVSQHLNALGLDTSASAVQRGVRLVAAGNGLRDPDRIFAADVLDFSSLRRGARAGGAAFRAEASAAPPARPAPAAVVAAPEPSVARALAAPEGSAVLEATLARAVRKGYMPAEDVGHVRDRIHGLAAARGFAPDDLAEVALMESDGFNPRASNGNCFGILQFCEGKGRGADSVGMRGRASEITTRSVRDQIDLVERYLDDVGVGPGPVATSLDDLYLAVLMPAARMQADPNAALGIPGRQARLLHEAGDPSRPITRTSIVAGLRLHAEQALGAEMPSRPVAAAGGNAPGPQRQGLAAIAAYDRVAANGAQAPAAVTTRW